MRILGIETSCDETSAALLTGDKNTLKLQSNIVASSLPLHSKTGGVIPEIAARQQVSFMLPALKKALGNTPLSSIDAIAVTYGPGLIGSLLVGVETAKTLSFLYNIPLVPVNHMVGHIYANFIEHRDITFPAVALVVSGGHTDLLLLKSHKNLKLLGGTRDDAAGEAFDKIGRLIGLSYPGGPAIEKAAKYGDPKRFRFPRPLLDSKDFDFSFSGLKTAVLREVTKLRHPEHQRRIPWDSSPAKHVQNDIQIDSQTVADISASVQDAIVDVLVAKTLKAAKQFRVKSILLSGGVAANEVLRKELLQNTKYKIPNTNVFSPSKHLCTDNAAMVAAAAFYNYNKVPWQKVTADPELYFE